MNRKKKQALAVTFILTVCVIGTTLAWFISQDNITNVFNTGSVMEPTNPDAGIIIKENFPDSTVNEETGEAIYNKPLLPGDKEIKEVSIKSTADYDQFLRAKVRRVWRLRVDQTVENGGEALPKDTIVRYYKITDDGKVIYSPTWYEGYKLVDVLKIQVEYCPPGMMQGDNWLYVKKDGYYYYNQILKGSKSEGGPTTTTQLIKSVTFINEEPNIDNGYKSMDNVYKNLRYDIEIKAEGIQASHGAAQDLGWNTSIPAAKIPGYMITP